MVIRLASEKDYPAVAKMRWLHAVEDDRVYGEKNTSNVDEHEYISKVIDFLNKNKDYKIFIAEEKWNNNCKYVYIFSSKDSNTKW